MPVRHSFLSGVSLLTVAAAMPQPLIVSSAAFLSLIPRPAAADCGTIGTYTFTGGCSSLSQNISGASEVVNQASITNLSISGALSGRDIGFDNQSIISILSNSALITGGATAIANERTIGTISNAGTISGSSYAIHNTNSLTAIDNTGTILGNISSASPLALSISGSGRIDGGSITTGGDVLITGAAPVLGDDIVANAGNGEVMNAATLTPTRSISITGNYTQGSSAILSLGTSGALLISRTADLSQGTIQASLDPNGNYIVGNSRTLVSAQALQSGASITVTPAGAEQSLDTIVLSNLVAVKYLNDYIGGTGTQSLTNGTTISTAAIGVYVASSGSLGTLTNTGIISGGSYAIDNDGTLGEVVNQGTLHGNIYSANNQLTIKGGAATYGELDGGTITVGSTGSGTLTTPSGKLWLDDDVVGHLANSGSTLKLSRGIAISQSFNQSGGGLLIDTSNAGTSYGYLSISGAASVTNAQVTISGSGLSAGESFTIVRSSASSTYSNDTATVSGTGGLNATLSTSGNDLIVTLVSGGSSSSYQRTGSLAGPNGGQIGSALDALANSASVPPGIQSILTTINGLPSGATQAAAIRQMSPSQVTTPSQMAFPSAALASAAITQHQEVAMSSTASGKAAGSDAHANAVWGQVLGGGAFRDHTADADGFNMRAFGLATGADTLVTDDLSGGVAVSWVRNSASSDSGQDSSSTLDNYMLTVYGTYRPGRFFVEGQAATGYNQFHQKRSVNFLGLTADADYGGEQYLLRSRAGYDVPLDPDLTATPLAGLTYLRTVNDGYTERGAGAADLTVARKGVDGLSHDVGGKVSWGFDTNLGRLTSEVRAEWVHDYRGSAVTTSGSLAGAAFATSTPRIASDGAQLGLAATLDRRDDLSLRVEYTGELRSNYQGHVGMAKVVLGF